MNKFVAVFCAMAEEIGDFKKRMTIEKKSSYRDCRVYEGKCGSQDTLLVLTGIGKERARRATEFVLEKYPVSMVISTGFGGGLNDGTETGDIVVYSGLICGDEKIAEPFPGDSCYSDSGLVSKAVMSLKDLHFNFLSGKGITTSKLCSTPQIKYQIGKEFAADAVDMESYWIGQIAAKRKLPFLAVRSILDSVQEGLPLLDGLTSSGKVQPFKVLQHFISSPGEIPKMFYYSRKARKACRNLAAFLPQLMERI